MADLPLAFLQLQAMIRNDLKRILEINEDSPVYAAALLVAIASEALSQLEGRTDDAVFTDILEQAHRISPPVGRTLFDAVRNGLAHVYDTKTVIVGKDEVMVILSWERRAHLSVAVEDWLHDGRPRPGVCLNVKTMCADLDAHFAAFGERLVHDPALARAVDANADKQRRLMPQGAALVAWREFLAARAGP